MIDLILLAAVGGAAYGGFVLGAKYKTLPALWAAMKAAVK